YGFMNILHDGRVVQFSVGSFQYDWNPASAPWIRNSAPQVAFTSSAAYNGLLGYNHDRNVAGGVASQTIGEQGTVYAFMDAVPYNGSNLIQRTKAFPFEGSRTPSCDRYRQDGSCFRPQEELHGVGLSPIFHEGAAAAMTSLGDALIIAVN